MIANLRKTLEENKDLGLAVLLAALSLILLILPLNLKQPLAKYTHLVTLSPFQGAAQNLKNLVATSQTNKWLRSQLEESRLQVAFAREALEQNKRLRDSLDFLERKNYVLISAEMQTIDPKRRDNAILVAVRNSAVVAVDRAVVSLYGLVGKTTNVLGNTITVELLTSPNCRVAARDQNTRALGIIRWERGQNLLLDNVPLRDSINVGDTVISSGLGGLFPVGLPIGVIEKIDIPKRGFFKRITVRPFVNFNRLDEVFILKEMED